MIIVIIVIITIMMMMMYDSRLNFRSCMVMMVIIITPYILGSIYSAKANGAEQMFETNNLNQT